MSTRKKMIKKAAQAHHVAKPVAAKPPAPPPKPTFASKAAFVRAQPVEMMAREVCAAGARAGLMFSEQYVYEVRAGDRERERKLASRATAAAAPAPAPPPTPQGERDYLAVKLVLAYGVEGAREKVEEAATRLEHAATVRG